LIYVLTAECLLQAALMANTEVLKEPRGFIRLIEIVSMHSFITQ